MSTYTTPELPIDERISKNIDWDINSRSPVSEQVSDTILTVSDLIMHIPVTKGLLKRPVGSYNTKKLAKIAARMKRLYQHKDEVARPPPSQRPSSKNGLVRKSGQGRFCGIPLCTQPASRLHRTL